LLKSIRWGAGWCPRRRPRTHGGLIQTTALVDRPSYQSIVMSAGKQIGQASKQKNEHCGSNPPKGVPQANSHNTWALARQGDSWPIANWEQRYTTNAMKNVSRTRRLHLGLGTRPAKGGPVSPATLQDNMITIRANPSGCRRSGPRTVVKSTSVFTFFEPLGDPCSCLKKQNSCAENGATRLGSLSEAIPCEVLAYSCL